jgi:hypothetical protein
MMYDDKYFSQWLKKVWKMTFPFEYGQVKRNGFFVCALADFPPPGPVTSLEKISWRIHYVSRGFVFLVGNYLSLQYNQSTIFRLLDPSTSRVTLVFLTLFLKDSIPSLGTIVTASQLHPNSPL